MRCQYQHAWATAVETVGTFISQALKSSVGEDEWLRFFALMGTAIAIREDAPPVTGTPVDRGELIAEFSGHVNTLNVENRLRAYGDALRKIEEGAQNAQYYLMRLSMAGEAPQLTITGYPFNPQAQAEYAHAEKYAKEHPDTDAVLVAVESVAALQRAYPNYFADTRVFVELMKQALSGRQRRIFISA